jgi:hypothetical protein
MPRTLFPVALIVVCYMQYDLVLPSNLQGGIGPDFMRWLFPPSSLLSQPVTLEPASLPLSRDYPSVLLFGSFLLSLPVVHYQYQQLEHLYGSIHTNDCKNVFKKELKYQCRKDEVDEDFANWSGFWKMGRAGSSLAGVSCGRSSVVRIDAEHELVGTGCECKVAVPSHEPLVGVVKRPVSTSIFSSDNHFTIGIFVLLAIIIQVRVVMFSTVAKLYRTIANQAPQSICSLIACWSP